MDTSLHQGKFIERAIKHGIVVYSLHTCLDRGQNGISMNDWLIQKLGVHDVACYDHYEVGKKATLNQAMEGQDFIEYVKDKFHLQHLKYSKNTNKMIHTIAICGGSGSRRLRNSYWSSRIVILQVILNIAMLNMLLIMIVY